MTDEPIRIVFMDDAPFWRLPEGGFVPAEVQDGNVLEPRIRLKSPLETW